MKEQLVQAISAFGAACKSDNALLIKLAADYTNQFLETVDVVALPPSDDATPEDAPAEA
jgi:hypothetical protein